MNIRIPRVSFGFLRKADREFKFQQKMYPVIVLNFLHLCLAREKPIRLYLKYLKSDSQLPKKIVLFASRKAL